MKKLLALSLTVILALTCFTMFASAANDSPTGRTVIASAEAKDNNNESLKIVISEIDSTDKKVVEPAFASTFDELNKSTEKDLKIVDQREVKVEGNATPTFPLTITFNVPGVTSSSEGYFLLYLADGTVEKITATMGKDTMTGVFNSLSPVAIVVDTSTAAAVTVASNTVSDTASETKSPKTSSDSTIPVALVLVCMGVVVAGVAVKKIKA